MKLAPEVRDALRALGSIGGKKGGPKGGKSRMANLTLDERRALAKKAAAARWARLPTRPPKGASRRRRREPA